MAFNYEASWLSDPVNMEREVTRLIDAGAPFPFKRGFLPPAAELFARLRENFDLYVARRTGAGVCNRGALRYIRWLYDGVETALEINPRAYECDVITDHFSEPARMAAVASGRGGVCSPLQAWRDPVLLACALQGAAGWAAERGRRVDAEALREGLYLAVPECTAFKPSLAAAVCSMFAARVVLDPSAGWGDRALGAAAAGVESYLGVDPNPALREVFADIGGAVAEFGSRTRVGFECLPFEDYVHSGPAPDLVFTSPPFFDYELYVVEGEGREMQSLSRFPSRSRWVHGWLVPAAKKMFQLLAPGGHLVLYLHDPIPEDNGPQSICKALHTLGAHFRGVIGCQTGRKRPLPLWVWRKPAASDPPPVPDLAPAPTPRTRSSRGPRGPRGPRGRGDRRQARS